MKKDSVQQRIQVPMRLIKQNVYARVFVPLEDEKKDYLQESYVSQDEVTRPGGVFIEQTVRPYEITPEYVKSFSDGTNYRNDLDAFVNRLAPGKNIGDVSALQELLKKSPQEVQSMLAKFADMIASEQVSKASSEVSDNEEVK